MIKISILHGVEIILKTLQGNSYEAYVVCGCVRDSLLNKNPNDWDITTNCLPEEIMNIFKSTYDFTIDAVRRLAANIKNVSVERIREEFNKILLSDNTVKINDLNDIGLLKYFIPEYDICAKTAQENPYHMRVVESLFKIIDSNPRLGIKIILKEGKS